MYQVKLAVIITAIVVVFASVTLADTPVGSGTIGSVQSTGVPEQQVGTVGKVEAPPEQPVVKEKPTIKPVKPLVTTPRWQTREGVEEATKRVLRGDFSPRKYAARKSFQTKGKQVNYQKIYNEIHSWNSASVGYVNKHDQLILERIHRLEKRLGGKTVKPEPTNMMHLAPASQVVYGSESPYPVSYNAGMGFDGQSAKNSIFMLIIAGILYALWKWGYPYYLKHKRVAKSSPDATNTATGKFRKRELPSSTIECFEGSGKLVEVQKAVKDLDGPNTKWQWAPSDGKLDISHTPGGRLRFLVSFVNWSGREIPTTASMVVADLFESVNYKAVPGSGRIYIGEKELGKLDDEFVHRLISGNYISLSEIIDKLPARNEKGVGRLNFVYEVDEADDAIVFGGGNVPDEDLPNGSMFRLHPEEEEEVQVIVATEAEPTTAEPEVQPEETKTEEETLEERQERMRKALGL
ncbi:MAG: hypothetical protein WCV58_03300 [Patescibacteria group bacterium]|jgi:hypothetical protein